MFVQVIQEANVLTDRCKPSSFTRHRPLQKGWWGVFLWLCQCLWLYPVLDPWMAVYLLCQGRDSLLSRIQYNLTLTHITLKKKQQHTHAHLLSVWKALKEVPGAFCHSNGCCSFPGCSLWRRVKDSFPLFYPWSTSRDTLHWLPSLCWSVHRSSHMAILVRTGCTDSKNRFSSPFGILSQGFSWICILNSRL